LIAVLTAFLLGCATATENGVRWPTTVTTPTIPTPNVAPYGANDCVDAVALRPGGAAPCNGVLVAASDLQYLMDLEAQRGDIVTLVTAMVAARMADRAYADAVAANLVRQRDDARRFIIGTALGSAIAIVTAIGVSIAVTHSD
jgi:hypothetical protein